MSNTSCPCPTTNPCSCLNTQVQYTAPVACPADTCCLKACNGTITCDNGAVGPCAQSGTFDLTTLPHVVSGCNGLPQFQLTSFNNEVLVSVSITPAGMLTWITADESSTSKYGEVTFKVICTALDTCESCFELKSNASLFIGVKNECSGIVCGDCETCNLCSGICEPDDVAIVAGP
jgi:hypothetical protein